MRQVDFDGRVGLHRVDRGCLALGVGTFRHELAVSYCRSCRANVAHTRQSGPDSGLSFKVKVLKTFQVVPSSLGSGIVNSATMYSKKNFLRWFVLGVETNTNTLKVLLLIL